MPITPKIRNDQIFGNAVPTPLSRKGRKNNMQNTVNIPVLMMGTKILDKIKARTAFLFFKALNTNPAIKPAIVVFNKQAKTVPNGLIGIKRASVDGDNNAIKPLKKPTNAPDKGPHIAAANTIVIKDKLMLTGPNWR